MESKETLELQKIIETWVHKKINTVIFTQHLARKISEYGLIDGEKTLPFQILPTTYHDSDGDVMCKIYLHIDHPIYGFFTIEVDDEKCVVNCPQIYKQDLIVFNHEECENWLDTLNEDMESFYQLSSAADNNQAKFCELFLNDLLSAYRREISVLVDNMKKYISEEPLTAILANKIYCLAKETKNDYTRALLLPSAWVVFKNEDDLPDQEEDIEDYVDEEKTESLSVRLNEFFRQESYLASPIYLAQRICLQSGLKISGKSIADNCMMNASTTEELGEFVLPPIDTIVFEVS
jgi:hypothetical protein